MSKALTLLTLSLLALIHFVTPHTVALDTDGLVGVWLLDEGKGETVKDSSGNGLDGKIAQGKPKWVKGKFDGAMEFGGSDMVTVDDDDALDLSEFTIAAWINIPKVSGAWQIIASKENRNPTGRNYGLFGHINTGVIHYSFTQIPDGNPLMLKPLQQMVIGITLQAPMMAPTSNFISMDR